MNRMVLPILNDRLLFIFVALGIYFLLWTYTTYKHSIKEVLKERKGRAEDNRFIETLRNFSISEQYSSQFNISSSGDRLFTANKTIREMNVKSRTKSNSSKSLFCTVNSNWNLRHFSRTVKSNMSSWNYVEKAMCPEFLISNQIKDFELKFIFSVQCEGPEVNVIYKKIIGKCITNDDVFKVNFGDPCLANYINQCCKDDLLVPNVVHYVRYGKGDLSFFEFVSFLSVVRFVRPCVILIQGDVLPKGEYWAYILNLSPNIVHVRRDPPKYIFGEKISYKEHASDIMRIEALLIYGGIYLDTDTVIVQSLKHLRKFPCSMSLQSSGYMSSAFIMAEPNATFLQKWLEGYKNEYKVEDYVYNAMVYPKLLSKEFKDLIHVDFGKLSRPWGQIGFQIYYTNCNWKGIFGIHLFSRSFARRSYMDVETVKHFNSTVGSICRHVLYGDKELCVT